MAASQVMSRFGSTGFATGAHAGAALGLLIVCLVASLSACSNRLESTAQASAITPDDDEYLRMAAQEWDSLFDAQDAPALTALYDEHSVSMPFDSPDILGRVALQGSLLSFFAEYRGTHRTDVKELLMNDDWCIERAEYLLTYSPRSAPQDTIRESGRHVVCRKKLNGQWLITWEIWNTNRPAEAQPGG